MASSAIDKGSNMASTIKLIIIKNLCEVSNFDRTNFQ
jgi:hypothetical protein